MSEGTELEQKQEIQYAGFLIRFGAMVVDNTILIVFLVLLHNTDFFKLGIFNTPFLSELKSFSTSTFVIYCAYYTYFTGSKYMATPGKRLAGLVVTDNDLNRVGHIRSFFRFIGSLLSTLILCLGYFTCLLSSKKRCLHDIFAGTLVIKKEEESTSFFIINILVSLLAMFIIPLMYILFPFLILGFIFYLYLVMSAGAT